MPMQSRFAWKTGSRFVTRRVLLGMAAVPITALAGGSVSGVLRSQAGAYALPGTFVGSVDISGLSQAEASAHVHSLWNDYLHNPVVFAHQETRWAPTASEIGILVDIERAIGSAFDSQKRRMWTWFLGLSARNQVALPVLLDSAVALRFLNMIAAQIDRSPVSSLLERQADRVRIVPGVDGKRLDREAIINQMRLPADPPSRQSIALPVVTLEAPITLRRAEQVKAIFERLVAEGLRFGLGGKSWQLSGRTLTPWLEIQQDPDQGRLEVIGERQRLHDWLEPIAAEAARPVKNARFTVDGDDVTVATPAAVGYHTDTETILATAQAAIRQGVTALYLPADVEEPVYTAANMRDWGFENLIAEGVSLFKGSPPERAYNIALAATKLHGYVIPPGATFSFLETLGPISKETGYQSSLIIWGDKTVQGDGGGVCQVSTTMFRAAFWAGLPIAERNQHTYRVGYYERDGSPPGFDAAIYSPGVDLRFVNDSEHPILIQTHVDEESMELKFALHGRSLQRTVRMLPAIAKNWVEHGPPLPDKPDPELPFGERKQIEWAVDGVDAEIQREVVADGVPRLDRFRSKYRPWRERWVIGTKLDLPQEQAGP